ncbi:sodium/hydrogen exchanger 6-like [Hydractinia symbiolongicarpus]|uniref:sodium/hydrogen exchanger 6-like n=1 Tax=Hydractinia symbiolongicarpus TaxID=13093 RepID=UPI00254EA6FF|nr:sodium/hydrogen exchanger 6-like [Hydractinia symbiolongicarpus]
MAMFHMLNAGFYMLSILSLCYSFDLIDDMSVSLEGQKEEEISSSHKTDSLSMLILISLLIATVLVIWLFKLRKFSVFHETGVAMLFGIIVGGIIHLSEDQDGVEKAVAIGNCENLTTAPRNVWMKINGTDYSYLLGGIVQHTTNNRNEGNELEDKSSFNPEIFFYVLLPPIIFFGGYSLKRRYFFRNLGAICMYAFIGTSISCLIVGTSTYYFNRLTGVTATFDFTECLLFGAMISATDPVTVLAIFHDLHVDVDLYALIFGESVLNDAVAIVLYRAIEAYLAYNPYEARQFNVYSFLSAMGDFVSIFVGSLFIGVSMACITALLTKLTKIGMFPILETALFFLMSYSTFLAAEVASWSGIVAVLFCGIAQKHYTYKNLTPESAIRTTQTFELLNFLAENFIFSYIGLSFCLFNYHQWNFGFIAVAFVATQVGRMMNVYPLSALLNLGRIRKIPYKHQNMMSFAGLRGAIAFSLAIRNTVSVPRQMMLTATLMIVLISVVLQGGLTLPFAKLISLETGVDEVEEEFKAKRLSLIDLNDPGNSPEDMEEKRKYEKSWLVRTFSSFDNKYLKPVLTDEYID